MENKRAEDIIENIYQARYEKLDKIIIAKIKSQQIKLENKIKEEENMDQHTKKQIKNIEEQNSIKNAIIMKEMYKQGLKDGINLIIQCQEE